MIGDEKDLPENWKTHEIQSLAVVVTDIPALILQVSIYGILYEPQPEAEQTSKRTER